MNILLINAPSREWKAGLCLPLGILYAGTIAENCGHKIQIFDPYLNKKVFDSFDNNNFDKIDEIVKAFKPSVIGFGGIATSYGRAKKLSCYIKKTYPEILQVAGGPLASVSELLLTKTGIDVVFHGETENSLPIFLEKTKENKSFYDTPGISYILNDSIVKNPDSAQIVNLDTIPFPNYELVDIKLYLHDMTDWLEHYRVTLENNPQYGDIGERLNDKRYYLPIIAARGCTHRCSFCYRHVQGVRRHSVGYVIKHIKHLMNTYGIRGFQLSEELFNSDRNWVLEFCNALEKLDIFYIIGGARVDKIDEEMLHQLKKTGCIQISYGHESGSDAILREYKKGVTSQQNKEITLLTTEKIGIYAPIQLVIGSPGETNKTIRETIQFLKDTNSYQYSINYLIPLPKTPIWQFVQDNHIIYDVEEYLDQVADRGGSPLVNLTKISDKVWKNWGTLIQREMKLYYYKKNRLFLKLITYKISHGFADFIVPLIPTNIKKLVPKWIKSWY